jgi:DNA-binding transcriptional ArsR family regulator
VDETPDIARIATLLADPARARILWALIDGTTRPASELAYAANISAQSASGHLAKLLGGGLLTCEAQGRHRYFRLHNPEVASLLEGMASLGAAGKPRAPRKPLPSASTPVQFLQARTCYGHLAGEMAVKVLAAMLESKWLVAEGRDLSVTKVGAVRLKALGIDVQAVQQPRRVFARACVDLTERRPHLSGVLGDALLDAFVDKGWVLRQRRSRIVTITPKGNDGLRRTFGVRA